MTHGKHRRRKDSLKKVQVRKGPNGLYVWYCEVGDCRGPLKSGSSFFWEIVQHMADEHVREWHHPEKHIGRDMPTPPGGTHIDWSDTGMHLRIRPSGWGPDE